MPVRVSATIAKKWTPLIGKGSRKVGANHLLHLTPMPKPWVGTRPFRVAGSLHSWLSPFRPQVISMGWERFEAKDERITRVSHFQSGQNKSKLLVCHENGFPSEHSVQEQGVRCFFSCVECPTFRNAPLLAFAPEHLAKTGIRLDKRSKRCPMPRQCTVIRALEQGVFTHFRVLDFVEGVQRTLSMSIQSIH